MMHKSLIPCIRRVAGETWFQVHGFVHLTAFQTIKAQFPLQIHPQVIEEINR